MSAATPEQARKAAEDLLSDVQSVLRHLDTMLFASEGVFSSFTSVHDDETRRLIGHADALSEVSAGLVKRAIELAENLEVSLDQENHLRREAAAEVPA